MQERTCHTKCFAGDDRGEDRLINVTFGVYKELMLSKSEHKTRLFARLVICEAYGV